MSRLDPAIHTELDTRLGPVDAELTRRYPGPAPGRQPVHTVYLPADRMHPGVVREWGAAAIGVLAAHPPAPYGPELHDRVMRKLDREPIEDLRIDFEDGYGTPADEVEDAVARSAATALRKAGPLPFSGLRIKSLEGPTRRRAVRTLDIFLEALDGAPPDGFVVTLPKVSSPVQVEAMVLLCERLEAAYGLPARGLRFEVQVETPPAVLGADGTATVARMIGAAQGRCTALHYGTYDYSAAIGVAAAEQSMAHPVADFAKAVMQVVAAGTGVRLSDGSTNVLPVGSPTEVRAGWELHAALVRRSLAQGIYQGWDMHPAQLPTRYAATYGFFRDGRVAAAGRLRAYLERRSTGVLDEPATARALAGFLLRGLDCGALDPGEAGFDRAELAAL
ncbi:HpcH/HpaI aldolase/citrate lyase family protein [Micromonospora pisi]|uniref:HpcH/HpaI aldolase/citrate lyase family protein n=1 Tax=Micromonospora pisi TaxID=589240 RepID=A0A495JSH7_9ACTN|nr:aldolase/citrate lyase family protein [Micromonospora pisi]RKR91478.1 HpcH/HpaI aldolase/citrate lyase family protein [Micromonospora pisi]